jgi:acyl-CoA dehydrogenase
MTFQGFGLPDELALLSRVASEFVRAEIAPAEASLPADAREIPPEIVAALQCKARAAGLWCMEAPREVGGGGLSAFEAVVVTEQAAKHKFSIPIHGAGVFGYDPPHVLYGAGIDLVERYVRPAIEYGWQSFTAISEASGGSDPARAIRTTAVRRGDRWVLSGRKLWASFADTAKFGIVYARTNGAGRDGISAFVIDTDTPGLEVTRVPVVRDHASTELVLNDCEIPEANLVGQEGRGFGLAQDWLIRGRLRIAAHSIGVAEAAVAIAIDWASKRETFGELLANRQSVQFALADARVELTAARHLTWDAAYDLDHGQDARVKASMAKLFATEASFKTLDAAMQILGGMGMASDLPLEHWFRGIRVWRVGEGPSEIHRHVIARDMFGEILRTRVARTGG